MKYHSIREASELTSVCPGFTVAWQAIMSELLGKGQCWDAEYCSVSTSKPTSSATSLRTASSILSPISTQINSGQPCSRKGDTDAYLWKEHKTGSKVSMKYSWESPKSLSVYNSRTQVWSWVLNYNTYTSYLVTESAKWEWQLGYCWPQL